MACENIRKVGQTAEERQSEIEAAVAKLEQALQAGTVTVIVGTNGGVVFDNWADADRVGVNDACAFQALTVQGSFALRQALAMGEQLAGRQASHTAILGGLHSHDGGQTWGHH